MSTAYACGKTYGLNKPNYTNPNQEFRNPYEKSKLEGEQIVITYAQKLGIKYRILRPSTISGRLIENEIGAIPKFNVFYGWALFFLKYKMKKFGLSLTEALNERTNMDIRIYTHPNAGLNIVPADFIAKTIYGISKSKTSEIYFHLTNEQETPHETYMSILLEGLNIGGYTFVSAQPNDLNALESIYYATVGKIFHGYVTQPEIAFDTSNLNKIYKKNKLKCPVVNEEAMLKLTAYAISKNFGIIPHKVLASNASL
jgi:nucleoside-diphosphate-sugar epimerase